MALISEFAWRRTCLCRLYAPNAHLFRLVQVQTPTVFLPFLMASSRFRTSVFPLV